MLARTFAARRDILVSHIIVRVNDGVGTLLQGDIVDSIGKMLEVLLKSLETHIEKGESKNSVQSHRTASRDRLRGGPFAP